MSSPNERLFLRLAFVVGLACWLILLLQPGVSLSAPINGNDSSGLAQAAQSAMAIVWNTVDDGGQTSNGGSLVLSGTIGQPDAGVHTGGKYSLVGGFWSGSVTNANASGTELYLPLLVR